MKRKIIKYIFGLQFSIIGALLIMLFVGPPSANAVQQALPASDNPSWQGSVFEMTIDELLDMEIITASKIPEPLGKTTSSVSVITADDLRSIGARTIYDALRHLPGISVGIGNIGENSISIRGVHSTKSEKILIMLNGHMLNDVRSGSAAYQFLDDLPVDNIQRIELVKGPGSALYGANAFLGVINIITMSADEINGIALAVDSEFEEGNTIGQRYNMLYGNRFENDLGLTFNANVIDHDGPEIEVEADIFGRSGRANTKHQRIDVQASVEKGIFSIQGRYIDRKAGDYFGITNVLGGDSNQAVRSGFIEARVESEMGNNLQLTFTTYIDRRKTDNYYEGFPAGSIPSWHPFFDWNSTGVTGNTQAQEDSYGGEVKFFHDEVKGHTVIWGLSGRHEKLHDVKFFANYNPGFLPEVRDVSDEFNWIDNADRNIWAFYIQDIWDISNDIRLLAGARDDYYSDFGNTFNPRAALLWDISEQFDLKLSYGTAFRSPDFYSQFVKNNPVVQGNPDLTAEKIQTIEASVGVTLNECFLIRTTLFHNNLNDLIDKAPGSIIFNNLGDVATAGVELEARANLSTGGYLTANYSYTESEYDNGDPFPGVPVHSGSILFDLPLGGVFNWNINAYWQGHSSRDSADTRGDLDSYTIVNTSLLAKKIWQDLNLRFSIFNLFDKNYAHPSALNSLPGDYPAAGRSFVLGAAYGF